MGKDKLDHVLANVATFIDAVKAPEPITGKHGLTNQVIFSHHAEGGLILTGDEAQQYRACLRQLIEVAASDERISRKSIEHLFQKAILASLDIHNQRINLSFDERLERAIVGLKKGLKRDSIEYHVFYPVLGLKLEGLPIRVGKVDFLIFDDDQIDKFREIIKAAHVSEEMRRHWVETFNISAENLIGKPIGIIKVLALDEDAAYSLALRELRLTIDTINFYSDLIPYSNGYAYLPGDTNPIRVVNLILVTGDKPGYHIQGKSIGPLSDLSIKDLLRSDSEHNLAFHIVNDKLANARDKLDDRLLAAVQWAGRATVEPRDEEAFLLYAIALESIILPTGDPRELTYRLSISIAHLLGKNMTDRRKIFKKVRDLYGVRSRIVHSGKYIVTQADLSDIRFIAKNCILKLVTEDPFIKMGKPDDLVDWFEEQILGPAGNE